MTINITLFVQVINFYIFYLLIKHFLINPFLDIEHRHAQEQQRFDQLYTKESKSLVEAQQTKELQWKNALKDIATRLPIKTTALALRAPKMHSISTDLSSKDIDSAAGRIAGMLLNKEK